MRFNPYNPLALENLEHDGAPEQFGYRQALSAALDRPTEPKTFCGAQLRAPSRKVVTTGDRTVGDARIEIRVTQTVTPGYVIATCSFHTGHVNDHRDVHTGATWRKED